ncbi:MAG: CocE/NonD family hydrolase [Spirochaetes bacterium]|nr:MAG: CocE/NonD family hydrolase [Spirochaetota bacterium]
MLVVKKKTLIVIAAVCAVLALVLLASYMLFKWRIIAWYLDLPRPAYAVTVDAGVMVPVRDGVKLAADLYRPDAPGKFPVILIRTPYGKENAAHKYSFAGGLFASQGYVVVVQDTRGKYASEGTFYPYTDDARDGYDTVEWAGTREWSTGAVGMYGFSYWGSTQWIAAAERNAHLKAIVPIMTSQNIYRRWIYDGIFHIADVLAWHYENAPRAGRSTDRVDWNKALRHLPLVEADNALGENIPAYDDWITHPVPGPYWDRVNVDTKAGRMTAPALIIDGWYDYYLDLAAADYHRMRTAGGSPEARRSMLLIGPWTHTATSKFDDVNFGGGASFMKQVKTIIRWFDFHLKGKDDGISREKPVRYFVMGKNEWRDADEWPPRNARQASWFLHSGGDANTAKGNGLLSPDAPGVEKPDMYTYDPDNPVPTVGGTSIYAGLRAGPANQASVEARPDVLVYTTPPLDADTEVTGPVKLELYASSSAADTDFSAQLADVRPDGTSINIKAAVVRARYRDSFENPALMEKGKAYRFTIEIGAVSNVFLKGHRIRLQVSSSNFPEFGRNLNSGEDTGKGVKVVKADQQVFHDRVRPSRMILPVMP